MKKESLRLKGLVTQFCRTEKAHMDSFNTSYMWPKHLWTFKIDFITLTYFKYAVQND